MIYGDFLQAAMYTSNTGTHWSVFKDFRNLNLDFNSFEVSTSGSPLLLESLLLEIFVF